jgi:hypothetical protein
MRRLIVLSITVVFVAIALGVSVRKSTATNAGLIESASRCTRLTIPKRVKPKKANPAAAPEYVPGSRCTRLAGKGKPGSLLPNLPPNIGLASSTAYVATGAEGRVDLKAIACDPDGDTMLYTYSATGGRIEGEGANAKWNLNGVMRPGSYTVTVEVDDGCGCIAYDSAVVTLD